MSIITLLARATAGRAAGLVALLALATPAGAGIYTWQDAQGRTHFGDQPPPELREQAEPVEAKAYAPGADAQAREIYQRANRLFDARDQAQRESGAQQARQQERVAEACRVAREREQKLAGRVFLVDDEGRQVTVSEEERKKLLQEQREWIVANCP